MREGFNLMTHVANPLVGWIVCRTVLLTIPLGGHALRQGLEGGQTIPEPAAIWASSPLELTIAFPRPVSARLAESLVGHTIPYSQIKPPALPIGSIRIAGATLIDEGRTMILATDPHSSPAVYRIDLAPAGKTSMIREYTLTGVEAAWYRAQQDGDPDPAWKGWWPDANVENAWRLTRGSAPHERGLALLEKPGRLVLSTLIKLPVGQITVHLEASGAISDATLGDEASAEKPGDDPALPCHAAFSVRSQGEAQFLTFAVETSQAGRALSIKIGYESDASGGRRKLEREHMFVSWAPFTATPAPDPAGRETPGLTGGDVRRGEALFFGDLARCSQCHAMGGRGGKSGPDLSEIGRKGRDQVYRSIAAPSAEIAPDYMTYTVASKDGRVMAGVVRAQGAEMIQVTDTSAKTTMIARAEIDQIRPSGNSIMPVGLAAALGPANLRDLVSFLCDPLSSNNSHDKK